MANILPAEVSGRKPKFRDVIRRKHFSIRTEKAYTDWIRRFILYHEKRHPRKMTEPAPQAAEWQRIGNQINAALVLTQSDFVNVLEFSHRLIAL